MLMTAVRIYFCGFLAFLLTLALPGQSAPRTADNPLEGLWKGPLQFPGGQLDVIFRLVRLSSGEYFATLDVPKQRVSNLAVLVTTSADSVHFVSVEAGSRFDGRLVPDSGQLEGTWQQPGLRVPMSLTHTALARVATRLTPPYREERVSFTGGEGSPQLAGMLTVPAGVGPFPAVALLSDAGPQDRNGTVGDYAPLGQLADYLTRRGIAVLRYDDRGVGESGGEAAVATTPELAADARAALAFLRTRPDLMSNQLGLVGHGEGGSVALLAAAGSLPPAYVVALAPNGLLGSDIAMQQREMTLRSLQMPPNELAGAMKRYQLIINAIQQTVTQSQGRAIVANMLKQDNPVLDETTVQTRAAELTTVPYRAFLSFNPAENLPKVACPVLLLYGTADQVLNPDANLAALTKGLKGNKGVTSRKLPGVNHLFQPDHDQWPIVAGESQAVFSPAAQDAVRAWILAQTGGPAAPGGAAQAQH